MEAVRIAEDSGNLGFHVVALEALGIAEFSADRFSKAIDALGQALGEAWARGTGRFEEASILSYLAPAHLGARSFVAARRLADESVAVARAQGARVPECVALLARAQVLRGSEDGAASNAITADLAMALALADETGARTHEPFIREELGPDQRRRRRAPTRAAPLPGHRCRRTCPPGAS